MQTTMNSYITSLWKTSRNLVFVLTLRGQTHSIARFGTRGGEPIETEVIVLAGSCLVRFRISSFHFFNRESILNSESYGKVCGEIASGAVGAVIALLSFAALCAFASAARLRLSPRK